MGKIAGREKVHVRSSVGELTKKIFPTGAVSEERSSESTPLLNPRTQRTLKEPRFSILYSLWEIQISGNSILYTAVRQWRFVKHRVTRGNPNGALLCPERIFFSSSNLRAEGESRDLLSG